jgi:UDP-glucose 4-epimerase
VYSWEGKRVLVTGGAGFVGSYLVEDLVQRGATVRVVDDFSSGHPDNLDAVRSDCELIEGDLTDPEVASSAVSGAEVVLHLAARAYGMLRNASIHDELLRDNCLMNLHVLDACRIEGVERALMVSSSCVYDDASPVPTPELPVQEGLPESVNEGYGWAKRILEIHSQYVSERYGVPIAVVRPFNAYGGRYRWVGSASHVVPSLTKRVLDGDLPVVIWGSGEQVRDLLHAKDFALGFRLAVEQAVDCEPINIAGGIAIRLTDLVEKIAQLAGTEVEIAFDTSKAEGRRRKEADLTRLHAKLPSFAPTVSLDDGLRDMIEWHARNKRMGAFDA